MKIQVYKPHFRTTFNEEDNSFTFINPEIRNLVEILEQNNHVELLSETDRKFEHIKNPDLKILLNGRLYFKDDKGDTKVTKERSEIKQIFNETTPQYHFITDWKIARRNENFLNDFNFKNVTACNRYHIDGELEKLFLYNSPLVNNKDKIPSIVYIGNKRGDTRDDDLMEYLKTNMIELFGNWDREKFPTSQGPLKFSESQDIISNYKYGLCLTEKTYIKEGHRTPRVWEYFRAGTYAFMDYKYPHEFDLFPKGDFRKVGSAEELKSKVEFLEMHPYLYEKEIQKQYDKIKVEHFNGTHQANLLNRIFRLK
jgi:hypothetical protein